MSYRESTPPQIDKTEVEKERIRQVEETKRTKMKLKSDLTAKRMSEYGIGPLFAIPAIAISLIVAVAVTINTYLDTKASCHETYIMGAGSPCSHPLHVKVEGICKCGVPKLP